MDSGGLGTGPAKGVRVKSPSRVRIPLSPPDQSLVLALNASANASYGNLRSADNFRGKHDATIASTGNGRRWPLGTYPDVSLEKARARHQAATATRRRRGPVPAETSFATAPDAFAETVGVQNGGHRQRGNPFASSNLALSAE